MIDLMSIDKNKDGMVYQDMMDWNVISDEPGKCPLCKMTLKEVSIEQARENLVKNDFKVKEN
jgi:Cu(I)/Ag(I) efflux system membrane fusion protein/cobalt-zinc-cadmium efflux system membrane fusion protein